MNPTLRRRRRLFAGVVAAVVALAVAWAVWAYAVIQTPMIDRASRVDAVLVLGGLDGSERTERAIGLVRAGLTHTVVLSMPIGSQDSLARQTCQHRPSGYQVICFRPDPSTTRGEAREISRLAEEHRWQRIAVVTSTYHVSRSRLIVGRCFHGSIDMLTSDESISPGTWAWQWLYQTAGYAKAEILRGC